MPISMSEGIALEASEIYPGDYLEGWMVKSCKYHTISNTVTFELESGFSFPKCVGPVTMTTKLLVVLGKNNPLYHIRQEING